MSVEDGAKLYDICPHVSDSVSSCPAPAGRWFGVCSLTCVRWLCGAVVVL